MNSKWNKVFEEALNYMELDLVKVSDNKWLIRDNQLNKLRYKDDDSYFKNSAEIIDNIYFMIDDYFIRAIEEDYYFNDENAKELSTNKDILKLTKDKDFCKDNADFIKSHDFDFEVLDLAINHYKNINLNKVFHEDYMEE